MRTRTATTIRFPPDVQRWVDSQAAARRMSRNDFVLHLVQQGIVAITFDEQVARIESAMGSEGMLAAVLHEVLVLRYLVSQAMPGGAHIATAAQEYAAEYLKHALTNRNSARR